MKHVALDISGMTCGACSTRVTKALARVDGVAAAEVNLALERANITLGDNVTPGDLIAAVEKAGYGAVLRAADDVARRRADETREAARRADERRTLLRFALSAVLTVPLVVGTLPMMLGFGHAWISAWTQAALAAGVMVIAGTRFYREAYSALRGGGANMAVLVSIGTTVAFVASLVDVVRANTHGHLYFEAAAVVLTLTTLGKYLEARAKRGASAALSALGRLQPREAERIVDGVAETVAVALLNPGDHVRVRPGSRVPVDGAIISGDTSIDESLITGESLPVERGKGDAVLTGSVNGAGAIDVIVTNVGADTRLARMVGLIEAAQLGEAPIQRLVDRISAIFVPAILVAAVATYLGWWLLAGDTAAGLAAAVALLVIACPCALGLATPTALVAGTGAAARAGILIRDIETLERAENIGVVAFDKTGTLTEGRPRVTKFFAIEDANEVLAMASAIEAHSEHPLGKALVEFANRNAIPGATASDVRAVGGLGLIGTVNARSVAVGSTRFAAAQGASSAEIEAIAAELDGAGTLSFILVDGKMAGGVLFADQPRPEAAAVVRTLQAQGVRTAMLTGDNSRTAEAVGTALGIRDIHAELLPEGKVDAVRELATKFGGDVAFVGDGMNDGPVLAAARLGIALSSGADVAREAAAMTLMRPDLRLVPAALEIAGRTRRTIRQNLTWAFIYNAIGIPLAALGLLSPVLAGAAMAFSSVSVVANSLRLTRWKPDWRDR